VTNLAVSMTFNELTPELRERGIQFFQAIENGSITGATAAQFFFRYFFQRLRLMFQDEPDKLDYIASESMNRKCMLAVKGKNAFQVTVFLKNFDEIPVDETPDYKAPKITFDNIWTVFAVIASDTSLMQAILDKRVKIDKMAALAMIFLPIEALNPKDRLLQVKEQDMELLSQILAELGF